MLRALWDLFTVCRSLVGAVESLIVGCEMRFRNHLPLCPPCLLTNLQPKSPPMDVTELLAVIRAQEAATAGMSRSGSEPSGLKHNMRIGAHRLYGFQGVCPGRGVLYLNVL
jgi:hypothetical protein